MPTKKETKFTKRMPPKGKILRRLTGKVTCVDHIDKKGPHLWRITLFLRRDEAYLDVPKETLATLGINEKNQIVELIYAKASGKKPRTILRPLKIKKISGREFKRLKAEIKKSLEGCTEF